MLGLVIVVIAIVISLSGITIQLLALRKSLDNIAAALGREPQAE